MGACSCGCPWCEGPPVERSVEIYALVDPRSGVVRYVGRSFDAAKRAGDHWSDRFSGSLKGEWLRELDGEGLRPEVRVLEAVAEMDAAKAEQRRMDEFGASLLNCLGAELRTKIITARIPEPLSAWVDAYAESRGVTRTSILETALLRLREDAERSVPDIEGAGYAAR